jgi:tetratricopeptide (TPR) repeat protein
MIRTLQSGLRNGCMAIVAMALATAWLPCSAADSGNIARNNAEHALMLGRVDEAAGILHQILASNPKDASAQLLLCRAFYAEDQIDDAVSECEAALANGLSGNSRAQDWMGRVYGKKADDSGPFTGLKLAHRVKDAFETAVNLDPRNADAVEDLGQYYVEAPSIVGGGLDRANALAARVTEQLPERAQRLRGLIAEKQKDQGTAERELRAVAERNANRPDGWIDLASYYVRIKAPEKAVAAVRSGVEANKKRDPSLYQAAVVLNKIHREPSLAEQSLRSYLTGNALNDDAPAFKAHYQLGKLLATEGNGAAAKSEYSAALALAANYAPARKALQAQ